ncbi:hypothetical protein [Streptosporangium sp. NPDC049078]|uniref:hypothetical protein n=1 Tax=Streptosporangium sp. NPDC049078 TaxID=3155767 RepID=UPI003449610F
MRPGDVLYAAHASTHPFPPLERPNGWVLVGAYTGDVFGPLFTRLYRRVVGSLASEPDYEFPQEPYSAGVVAIAAAYGISASIPPRITWTGSADSAAVPTPDVPPAAGSHLEIRFGLAALSGAVDLAAPAGYTPRGQIRLGGIIAAAVASKQITSSAPSGTKNFTASPSAVDISHGITISLPSADVEPDPEPQPPYQPGKGDALYQYGFSRVRDRSYLGHLDLANVSFEKRINRAGQINSGPFTGRVTINSADTSNLVNAIVPRDPLDLTRGPGVVSCEILRDGEPYGEYWIIGATVSKQRGQPPTLELRGLEIDAYWAFVELQESLGELTGEREDLARQLLEHLAAQPYADLGLVLQGGSTGSPVTRTYTDEAQSTYAKHISELTEGAEGFEHVVNIVAGPSGLERHWVHGAPLGDPDAGHSFSESPTGGDILDWSFEITPLRNATRWRARGEAPSGDASTTAVPLVSTVHESTAHLTAGHLRLDRTVDRPGVFDLETLEDYAARWAATSSGAVRIWQVTVLAGEKPSVNPNCMGDGIGISMINEYFPRVGSGSGYDERHRLIGLRVTPVGRENGKDEFGLILAEPEEVA